ncbi:MAG: hypothetical protein ACJ8HI_00855 [Massilia sp.]
MDNATITPELVDKVLHLLDEKRPFKKELISTEIQDDFRFLLISIAIDEFPESEPSSTFKRAGLLLNEVMPSRSNDDSWMIAFTRAGKVVDSYFGGNLASPNSGL